MSDRPVADPLAADRSPCTHPLRRARRRRLRWSVLAPLVAFLIPTAAAGACPDPASLTGRDGLTRLLETRDCPLTTERDLLVRLIREAGDEWLAHAREVPEDDSRDGDPEWPRLMCRAEARLWEVGPPPPPPATPPPTKEDQAQHEAAVEAWQKQADRSGMVCLRCSRGLAKVFRSHPRTRPADGTNLHAWDEWLARMDAALRDSTCQDGVALEARARTALYEAEIARDRGQPFVESACSAAATFDRMHYRGRLTVTDRWRKQVRSSGNVHRDAYRLCLEGLDARARSANDPCDGATVTARLRWLVEVPAAREVVASTGLVGLEADAVRARARQLDAQCLAEADRVEWWLIGGGISAAVAVTTLTAAFVYLDPYQALRDYEGQASPEQFIREQREELKTRGQILTYVGASSAVLATLFIVTHFCVGDDDGPDDTARVTPVLTPNAAAIVGTWSWGGP